MRATFPVLISVRMNEKFSAATHDLPLGVLLLEYLFANFAAVVMSNLSALMNLNPNVNSFARPIIDIFLFHFVCSFGRTSDETVRHKCLIDIFGYFIISEYFRIYVDF